MFRWARIPLSVVFLFIASNVFAEDVSPTHVLTWDADYLSPGWISGAENSLPVGPGCFDFNHGGAVVSDAAHRRLLILDENLVPRDSFHVDVIPADLRLDRSGKIYLLSSDLDRIYIYGQNGELDRAVEVPEGRVRSLATGPDGGVWWEDRHGHAHSLDKKQPTGMALPMGEGSPWHATGRQIDKHRGEVLLWKWGVKAEVKPPGPARTYGVETSSRLGSIRPLGMDEKGRLFVRVETLSETAPLVVTTEVLAYAPSGAIVGRVSWVESAIAPTSWNIRVTANGVLIRMESQKTGLAFWRQTAQEWITGGAR